jgi:hypothetical protein
MYSLVKDDLVLINYLGTHDIALSSFASAQHELWSYNLTNGIYNKH